MVRSSVYLKVVIDHNEDRPAQRVSGELVRVLSKVYGVREVEVSSIMTDPLPDIEP